MLRIQSIPDLFDWKESESPPDTQDSEVVRFFVYYLCVRWRTMFAHWRDYPRFPREMVVPGYRASDEGEPMLAACPGDHDRWAGALIGLYCAGRNERLRRELDIERMTASLAELNQQLKKRGGLLYAHYINYSCIPPSRAGGDAYKALLLSPHWRTLTAAKQASGSWRNPSWEMFNHWAKLVACAGYQPHEIRAPQAQPTRHLSPAGSGPIREWQDGRRPPPFIDPEDIVVDRPVPVAQAVDKNVYDVYNTLRTQEPKLDLGGYSDITPTRWESYTGWALT
ncbi:MAG TPA: hypothetical protein VMW27_14730, partial [Thermoanaerobaculia bacterium]|nr:hypothetical protein [Thermoanaerobaculia bacterium]